MTTLSPCRGDSSAIFDPEYAVLRATLLSLARDGHRLIGQISKDQPEVDSPGFRGFLERIDLFDEQTADRQLEPVRRWAQSLKRRVLDTTSTPP
jgi:hypothetical protein